MNKFLIIATLLALSSTVMTADSIYKKNKSGVLILTDKNFDAAVQEFPKLFVKFYAPWCPHCKKLSPKWNKLAREHAEQEDGVVFAKINAEKHPNSANDHQVNIDLDFIRITTFSNKFVDSGISNFEIVR